MTIRPAGPDDVPAVAALERELFGVDAWAEPSVREELTGERRRAMVAATPEVVGYAVTLHTDEVVDLQRIGVAPTHRRAGVAHRLLAALLPAARSDGATRMLLEVSADNAGALAFYAGEGFAEIDRRPRYYRDGSDAVVLELQLGRAA